MGTTSTQTRERLIALVGVVAGLLPALGALPGLVTVTQWDPGVVPLRVGIVVGGVAAVVLAVAAGRRGDRVTLGFALASVCFALAWIPLGPLSFPISTIIRTACEALLIAFGIVVLRRSVGAARVSGWLIAIAGSVWLLGGLALWFGTLPGASQTMLGVLFTIPAVGQLVAFLASAALFVGPLLRPVRAGARFLWSTADVR